MKNFYSVITTIQLPTKAVHILNQCLQRSDGYLIVVGDKKGPYSYDLSNSQFFSLDKQLELSFTLAKKLPMGHYTRKNLGYLEAIRQGATCIYETDDDNAPLPSWTKRSEKVEAYAIIQKGWVNAYRCFSQERIWPRGLPLDSLISSFMQPVELKAKAKVVQAPIQQGLANGSPDVDAIWRLVLDKPFNFDNNPSVYLSPGSWCPFNSQSTWWWPVAYPLMYLPSYCSFRVTDIWRSFVAQRCLWELDMGVVFHAPEVEQERNLHSLMKDFEDEVPGYLSNQKLIKLLDKLVLRPGTTNLCDNLWKCYEELVNADLIPSEELNLLDAWLAEFS